jgi:predicted HTH domain antitoxin
MKTISIDIPESAVFPVSASDEEFARGLRLAAAIFWYDRGLISQGKGAAIAGMSRVAFIDALGQANVSAIQTSVEELKAELEGELEAGRQRLGDHLPEPRVPSGPVIAPSNPVFED